MLLYYLFPVADQIFFVFGVVVVVIVFDDDSWMLARLICIPVLYFINGTIYRSSPQKKTRKTKHRMLNENNTNNSSNGNGNDGSNTRAPFMIHININALNNFIRLPNNAFKLYSAQTKYSENETKRNKTKPKNEKTKRRNRRKKTTLISCVLWFNLLLVCERVQM